MILNPVVQGGGETATVTIKSHDTISSPDYGLHYITSDGTKGYAPLNSTEFIISVAKNSFILPLMIGDVRQDALSGALEVVANSEVYTRSGHTTNLVYVSGDGVITV